MKRLVAITAALSVSFGASAQEEAERNRLIVHEWGTFTAVYGADGTMLEWRPLDEVSDLPSFVYARDSILPPTSHRIREKNYIDSYQRMETPVLYFYADREMAVDVSVGFPKGLITEWYPRVRDFGPWLGDGNSPLAVANGWLRWGKIKILPQGKIQPTLPREKGESHYYPARETDSAYVRLCPTGDEYEKTEYEKFLFYRGVGNFELPLQVTASGKGSFKLHNLSRSDIGHVFVLSVKKGGKGKYTFFEKVEAGTSREATLDLRENWLSKEQLVRRIGEELEECLVMEGLFRKEAKAMIQTWTDSYFEQEGTRILYILPEGMTNELLPLSISPKPVELKRVMVARVEVISPEQTHVIHELIEKLGSDNLDQRVIAERQIAGYGRFAEPMLKEAVRVASDPEIRARAEGLLAKMHSTR